jgi:heme/copper-type cytochrome/quinol oxidase subunit 2
MKKLNMKKFLKGMKSKVMYLLTLLFLLSNTTIVKASNPIAESKAGKGFLNLINDASLFLLVCSPIVGGLFAVYFLIRKNAADEQDQKQWNKRLTITGFCVVGAVLVTSTITVVTGYFK